MLVFSADMRSVRQDCLEILKNKEILAVNQDPAANAPHVLFTHNTTVPGSHPYPVTAQGFSRLLQDGSVALLLLNRDDNLHDKASLGANWTDLGLPSGAACQVR